MKVRLPFLAGLFMLVFLGAVTVHALDKQSPATSPQAVAGTVQTIKPFPPKALVKETIKVVPQFTHKVSDDEFVLISANPGELRWLAITVDGVRKLYTFGGDADVELSYYQDCFNLIKAAHENLSIMIYESENPVWCSKPFYSCPNFGKWLIMMEDAYKMNSPEYKNKEVDAKFLLDTYVIEDPANQGGTQELLNEER